MEREEKTYRGSELLRVGERNIERNCALEYLHGHHAAFKSVLEEILGPAEKNIAHNGAEYSFRLGKGELTVSFFFFEKFVRAYLSLFEDSRMPRIVLPRVDEITILPTNPQTIRVKQDNPEANIVLEVQKSGLVRADYSLKGEQVFVHFGREE